MDGTTADIIFGIDSLVAYISRFMTLPPGDIIVIGTPAGIGVGMSAPTFSPARADSIASGRGPWRTNPCCCWCL